jgi:hypothetical protein
LKDLAVLGGLLKEKVVLEDIFRKVRNYLKEKISG